MVDHNLDVEDEGPRRFDIANAVVPAFFFFALLLWAAIQAYDVHAHNARGEALAARAQSEISKEFSKWHHTDLEGDVLREWKGEGATILFITKSFDNYAWDHRAWEVWAKSSQGNVFTIEFFIGDEDLKFHASERPERQTRQAYLEMLHNQGRDDLIKQIGTAVQQI